MPLGFGTLGQFNSSARISTFKQSLSDMIIGNRIFDSGVHNRDLFRALLLLSNNDLVSCDQARKFTCV